MRGGVRRESEVMLFSGGAQVVEHHSRLHAGEAAVRIDFENRRHVPGEIENDGDVAALSSQRRTAAATKQWRSELAAERDGG